MPALKAASIKVIHKCTSVRHSLKAERILAATQSVSTDFDAAVIPAQMTYPQYDLAAARR